MPRDVDQAARDLISQILILEPNLRLKLEEIKEHRFFNDINWKEVSERRLEPIPYKPNPMKFRYLLQNSYQAVTNDMPQSPKQESPKKTQLLGGLSLYKINKELEDF